MLGRLFRKTWFKVFLTFAFWTLIGLSFASQLYLTQSKIGYPVAWKFAVGSALADWYIFALLSISALWLSRRFRFERTQWRYSVIIHFLASAVFSILWVALRVWVEQWHALASVPSVSFTDTFAATLVKTFYFNLLIYWVIVSVSHAFEYYRKFQERAIRAAELENRLTQAKLQALQMQLNPHFLFNTLHAISALMHQDVEAADRMITRLSDLLRNALENVGTQEVPLREELAFLDSYLEIEQTRFGERLTLRKTIAPETLDALVPNLVLQPLVENAIQHGIEPHAKPGLIELHVQREAGSLQLQVRDNGHGLPADRPFREGVGLSNTRARLQQLYGQSHRFELSNGQAGGLEVSVTIPFRLAKNGSNNE